MSLCLKCGAWKQAASSRCGCGFKPAKGSIDEAKSYVLTTQFRSPEVLEANRRTIQSGGEVVFSDEELQSARGIGNKNAAVTLMFLSAAVFTGLFLGALVVGVTLPFLVLLGAVAFIDFAIAFALMKRVDQSVTRLQ